MSSTNGTNKSNFSYAATSNISTVGVEQFKPGHTVSVGSHQVEIIGYLAEGGFAQVYTVKFVKLLNEFDLLINDDNSAKSNLNIGDTACLKRVIVTDEAGLSEMKNEISTMQKLKRAPSIVQYYDSNATKLQNGSSGYEVFLLMELCSNKSLLDYMNDRLVEKLSVEEIYKIMYDVTLAISQMHYLATPLIHRDIKIENVLVDANNNFKLCDFGSTSPIISIAQTHQDIALATQNIFVHTTPQYRSPEMIDLYRYLPINEKSDIWALGIFLYKLLFYTTPFELTGQFAIAHSKYDFPNNNYPNQLITLTSCMLMENPHMRPNIYQVLRIVSSYMNKEVPISDKYGDADYNLNKCLDYQRRLNDIQYQLFLSEQQTLNPSTRINEANKKLYNDLFTNLFEVAPKINYIETNEAGDSNISRKKSNTSNLMIPEPERDSGSSSRSTNSPKYFQATANHEPQFSVNDTSIKNTNEQENKGDTYYPTMNEFNGFLDNELNTRTPSLSLPMNGYSKDNTQKVSNINNLTNIETSSKQDFNAVFSPVNPQPITNNPLSSTPVSANEYPINLPNVTTKVHKSNNPFPSFNNDNQENQNFNENNRGTLFLEEINQVQPQIVASTNFNNMKYDEGVKVNSTPMNNIPAPPTIDNIFQINKSEEPKKNRNFDMLNINNETNMNKIIAPVLNKIVQQPNVDQTQQPLRMSFQYIPQQGNRSSVDNQDNSRMNLQNYTSKKEMIKLNEKIESSTEKPSAINTRKISNPPKEEFRKPLDISFNEMNLSTDSNLNNRTFRKDRDYQTDLLSSDEESNNGVDANPRDRLKQLNDNYNDIRSQESVPNSRIRDLRRIAEYDEVSETSTESIKIILDDRRRTSMNKDALATENIPALRKSSLNLQIPPMNKFPKENRSSTSMKAGRNSLDLKYEEIDFSRRRDLKSLNNLNHIQTHPHNSTQITHSHNGSNSSINTNNKSGTPVSRVRQSLDIERLRKEAQRSNNSNKTKSNSSKKSFFSIFKNDKK